ncbi:M56 family metallopeptidase [Chengkuizengella sp. SCS-71B]|uniref:M56 family metallopeptidase n=1 Tax=Chengkuizengella sp. SCS-71B TaxID=3115290 RepID=UPI0032C21829
MDLTSLFKTILNLSLMSSVVIGMIILVKLIFKDKLNPQWHYYIWFLVILRLIIPYTPESSLSIFNLFPQTLQQIDSTQHISNAEVFNNKDNNFIIPNTDKNANRGQESLALTPNQVNETFKLNYEVLGIIWITGTLIILLTFLIVNTRFHWKLRKQSRCEDVEFTKLLANCKIEMKMRDKIIMIYDDAINTPSITGLIRPKLLLPKEIIHQLSDEEKRYVFLHELTHLKRKDIFITWITLFVQAINWFNPLVWYAFYRMREDGEVACDAYVLSHLKKSEHLEYGKTIITVLTKLSKPNLIPVSMGMAKNKKMIKRRILRIKTYKKTSFKKSVTAAVLAVGIGLVGLTSAMGSTNTESSVEYIGYISDKDMNGIFVVEGDSQEDVQTDSDRAWFSIPNDLQLDDLQVGQKVKVLYSDMTSLFPEQFTAEKVIVLDDFWVNIDIPSYEIFDTELILEEAKELGIETEGKTIEEILEELDHIYLMEEAKEVGIDTEGKAVEEIMEELDHIYLMEEAKEVGIETEGKTIEEILEEVDNIYLMEAETQGETVEDE